MIYLKISSIIQFCLVIVSCSIIYSCSSMKIDKKLYHRENNPESQLLNEYIIAFIENTEPFHFGDNIFLEDSLYYRKKPFCCFDISKYPDSLFREAHLDLKDSKGTNIGINFSQLKNLSNLKVYPGKPKESDGNNWSFRISLPGFSKDSTHIVFISSYYCGPLSASIDVNFMKKVNGEWIYVGRRNIMMS
ncbi:MAG: hypothetical protein NT007_03700 [Candidatus Kapabacteria bacterium]|nr:hypothetical protein [Candidatus Kapabacteria bacterium]